MKINKLILSGIIFGFLLLACNLPFQLLVPTGNDNALPAEEVDQYEDFPESGGENENIIEEISSVSIPVDALPPESLVYQGAFRLPDDSGGMGWGYSGHGMTYYPHGDPSAEDDGFPGSLFIVGHDHQLWVGEVSIPKPVISKNLEDLNTAQTLQPLADITGGAITEDISIPRMGIEYLPDLKNPTEGKLHFTVGQHFQDFEPSHGWASLDLANPNPQGFWVFDGFTNYATNDYLFEIPQAWSDTYTPGHRLATGRFREGVWSGSGPALFAYSPWEQEPHPPHGGALTEITPLLLYGIQLGGVPEILTDDSMRMNGYAESDHWWGGAWLSSDSGSAVVFTGTKALGRNWYGFSNGVIWDYACADDPDIDCPDVPEFPHDNRGFWAEAYMPAILFFNPADLAQVAQGQDEPYEPQPYALMDLTPYWLDPVTDVAKYKRDLVGAAAFDRDNGLLYIVERLGDADKSIIHVFKIGQ